MLGVVVNKCILTLQSVFAKHQQTAHYNRQQYKTNDDAEHQVFLFATGKFRNTQYGKAIIRHRQAKGNPYNA